MNLGRSNPDQDEWMHEKGKVPIGLVFLLTITHKNIKKKTKRKKIGEAPMEVQLKLGVYMVYSIYLPLLSTLRPNWNTY